MLARSVWRGWSRKIGKAGIRRRTRVARSAPVVADVLEPRALLSAITVTTLADNMTAGDGQITLREALAAANTNASVDGSTAGQSGVQDEILFASGLIGTIQLDSSLGQFQVTDSVRIVGNGAKDTIVDAQLNSRVFDVTSTAGDVAFEGVTITGGSTTGDAERGGGIRFLSPGTLTLTASSVSGNQTNGFTSFGGGIYTDVGAVVAVNSLISGNSTLGRSSDGAGIFSQNGPLSLTNSTLSGNTTSGYHSDGAAIYTVGSLASVSLTNSTVTRNDAIGTEDGGSGGVAVVRAAVTVNNSILTGNYNRDGSERDLWISGYADPQTFSASHSILGATSEVPIDPAPVGSPDANGNLVGTISNPIDARLAPLADNGGATKTHALYAGSPAIDAGDNALAVDLNFAALTTDQRGAGFPRIDHSLVDMGSYEGTFGNYPVPSLNGPLVVTVADDELDSDLSDPNDLSLREAIELANNAPGIDTITFSTDLLGATIKLSLGQLAITDSLTIAGLGAANTTIDADGEGRVFDIGHTAGAVTFDGITIRGGLTESNGEKGAGIRMHVGTLTLNQSVVTGNTTLGNRAAGGGIYAYGGSVNLVDSLISGNSTHGLDADGGGIFTWNAAVNLTNSTVSGNTTGGYGSGGGGIYSARHTGNITLTNSTVTNNYGTAGERDTGGGIFLYRGWIKVYNSIVSGNSTPDGGELDIGMPAYSSPTLIDARNSIIGADRGNWFNRGNQLTPTGRGSRDAMGNMIGTVGQPIDARLGPLADNGGATMTHALYADSPAIDFGDNALAVDTNASPLPHDQRGTGFPRINHSIVDAGSYEGQFGNYPVQTSHPPLVVTITTDELDADLSDLNDLSLREAIEIANQTPGLDTITFASALSGATFSLTLGQLTVLDDLKIVGLGASQTTLDAQQQSRVIDIPRSGVDLTLDGLTVTGGKTSANQEDGGGIRMFGAGTLTLKQSIVSGNSTVGHNSYGGGIYAFGGSVIAVDSLISGNSTTGSGSDGGAIFSKFAAITLTNSTLSGNTTSGYHSGGAAMYTLGREATLTLTNSTVTNNNGIGNGVESGGGIVSIRAAVRIINSIVSGNYDENGTEFDVGISGYADPATFFATHSIIGANVGNPLTPTGSNSRDANGNMIGTIGQPIDARLAPLADNGGATKTHALFSGSPAIDAGDNALALGIDGSPLTTDQRGSGFPRIDHALVDIGAFEGHYPNYPPETSHPSLVVTTSTDELDTDLSDLNDLSLREALQIANQTPGLDTITFASGLSGTTFSLTLGQLTVLDDLNIVGFGASLTVIDAQQNSRVIGMPRGGVKLSLDGLTITGGTTTGHAEVGGGIAILADGTLTLTGSAVTGNSTTNDRSLGGGIYAFGGKIIAQNSLISGNSTSGLGADGGAIYSKFAAITLTNSTLTGNTTSGYHSGGAAMYTLGREATVTLTNSTVTDNNGIGPGDESGGGVVSIRAAVRIVNSIVSGNYNDDGTQFDVGISGYANPATFFATHSIIGTNVGNPLTPTGAGSRDANGNIVGTEADPIDARLAPLADNGGATMTHALLENSPALNGGDNSLAVDPDGDPLPFDQRGSGFPRIVAGTVDMGATEANTVSFSVATQTVGEGAGTVTVTVNLAAPSTEAVSIPFSLSGTANRPWDFSAPVGPLVIPAGQTSGTLTFRLVDDALYEPNETIVVALDPSGDVLRGQFRQTTITIVDNEAVPTVTLSISPASLAEGGGQSTVTATLSGPSASETVVNLGYSGSATNGVDYVASGTQIVIPAAQPASVSLSDSTFADSNWVTTVVQGAGGGTGSGTQIPSGGASGGSADPFRETTNSVNDPLSRVLVFHERAGLSFDPGTQGMILSLDYSEMAKIIQNAGLGLGQVTGLAIKQNGKIYALPDILYADSASWTKLERDGIVAADLAEVVSSATYDNFDLSSHPDFSTDGAPITFGFIRWNENNFDPAYTTIAGIDDWTVEIHYLEQSNGSITLTALDDQKPEPDETVIAQITGVSGAPSIGSVPVTGTIVDDDDFDESVPAFPRENTIAGFYFDGNGITKVLADGDQLTIIDSNGKVSQGTLPNQSLRVSTLAASSTPTPVSFDPLTGALTFSNGAVWNKVSNLAGRWLNANAQETGVRQLGADLTFTNVLGQSSSGRFLSANQVIATDWGNLIGTLTNGGQRIEWANGRVWDLIPDLESNWSNPSQQPTRVEQLGSQLVFVNRLGQTSAGRFLDATHVVATGWGNMQGNLVNGTIEWANGTVWTQLPGAVVDTDLAGLWDVAGKDTRVLQAGQTLTFVNRLGGISGGHFLTSTTVIATDWNVQGTITGDLLRWSNGTVWTRLPELGGAWIDQTGKESGINQLERSLTFTDAQGRVTHGTLVSPNRVTESGTSRNGSLAGDLLTWSDGKVWSQIADLRGSWTTTPGSAPTFVTQSGLSLLMVSDTGVVGRGKFIAGKVASMVFDGASTVAVNVEVPGKSSLAFANGWLWQRPTTSALDDVFSDPNLWPFA